MSKKIFDLPHCINKHLAGNGLFREKVFEIHGQTVRGVFPDFDGPKVTLDPYYMSEGFWADANARSAHAGYHEQMKQASRKLHEHLQNNPSEAAAYTAGQLAALEKGSASVPGKVWHHYEELGEDNAPILQLVDEEIHRANKHTGGSYTWNEQHFIEKYGPEWFAHDDE